MLNKPMCSVSTLAKLFVLSERRIQQLGATGIIPRAQKEGYCIMSAVNAYVLFLREQARLNTDPEAVSMAHERLRLLKARADRADYENQRLRKTCLDSAEVYQAFEEVGAVFTACVDALPGRLAFELTGMDDPSLVKAKLFEACRQLRNTTGEQLDALQQRLRYSDNVSTEDQSALAEDTGSVGGSASLLTTREC